MSVRGRSPSPRAAQDGDVEMGNASPKNPDKSEAKVIIVTNLTRNVVEAHLNIIFGFYGQITKIDLPLYGKCKSFNQLTIRIRTSHS
jgi:RNA-binding protein with serine-rich domain 1